MVFLFWTGIVSDQSISKCASKKKTRWKLWNSETEKLAFNDFKLPRPSDIPKVFQESFRFEEEKRCCPKSVFKKQTKPNQTKLSQAKPNQTKPSQAKPSQAKPSQQTNKPTNQQTNKPTNQQTNKPTNQQTKPNQTN